MSPPADSAEDDTQRVCTRGRIIRCTTHADEIRIVMPDGAEAQGR